MNGFRERDDVGGDEPDAAAVLVESHRGGARAESGERRCGGRTEEKKRKSGGKGKKSFLPRSRFLSSFLPSFLLSVVARRRGCCAANFIPSLVYSDRRPPPPPAASEMAEGREREGEREREAITGNIKHGNFQKGCMEEEEKEEEDAVRACHHREKDSETASMSLHTGSRRRVTAPMGILQFKTDARASHQESSIRKSVADTRCMEESTTP